MSPSSNAKWWQRPRPLAGHPFPLGAHPEGDGVRFAVTSAVAEAVELCLVDAKGRERRVELTERTFGVWHAMLPGIKPGQRYGYRVHGPYQPRRGLRCNPAKLLLDPYARRITGALTDPAKATGYADDPFGDQPSEVDSLGAVPLSVVTSPGGPETGPRPNVPWEETVIYELHVRGFTHNHPAVPRRLRGTYLGLAHSAVIEYLHGLGVTAVELMPVMAFADEPWLTSMGRHNYWGYSPLGFLAPHAGYATRPGREVEEFRAMVAALHAAGIEVIVDVVFNHTCEGGGDGPTLCYRGLDSAAYYLHNAEDGDYFDITGTGNTLDAGSPTVVRLVTDSLRYWADELGVDGFRFDLASVLGRPGGGRFDPDATLLTAITTDPQLATRKLIAEPWDATGEGYCVGAFGNQWSEWNGRFRDTVRDFWRGQAAVRDLATRLSGSSDLYADGLRRPWASINFVTAHDGFTVRDLVSYNDKHNEDNGEDGRDGTNDNRSWNCGVEGETDDPEVLALRDRQARNLMATVLLSTGTPMLLAGDERWRTQRGNNNAYCQDNDVSWLDWTDQRVTGQPATMTRFTQRLVALRLGSPALRQPEFFEGRDTLGGEADLVWFRADGAELTEQDWFDDDLRTLGMWVDGSNCRSRTREGDPIPDYSWLLVLHAGPDPMKWKLPSETYADHFEPMLDTSVPDGIPAELSALDAGSKVPLPGHTALLFRASRR
ncbi:MAG TPA: glycogen debranching protein GlgX [Pseudonocardiaceae bacterium]|nr:glycogen debranching protein GlgX [Pseudonocardiaceae bacterium]